MPPLLEAYNYGGVWGWVGNLIQGTLGVFALGNNTTITNVYTYSGNTVVAGTALTATVNGGAAAGTSTIGVFALGNTTPTTTTTTNVYTYSGNTVVAGTALTAAVNGGAAAGNYNGGLG